MGSSQSSRPRSKTLRNLDPKQVSNLPLKGKLVKCRVTNVHDGDTITIIYIYGKTPLKVNIRLQGLDAPELNSKNSLEKKAAENVRDWLKQELDKQKIWYWTPIKHDKYGGRVIGTVQSTKKSKTVNQVLIDRGMVVEYNGTKKEEWTQKKLKSIIAQCSKKSNI